MSDNELTPDSPADVLRAAAERNRQETTALQAAPLTGGAGRRTLMAR